MVNYHRELDNDGRVDTSSECRFRDGEICWSTNVLLATCPCPHENELDDCPEAEPVPEIEEDEDEELNLSRYSLFS